ncbi:hypothetical protein SXCC_00639 [Gluconacetobacter sp. SXCC-1]|uniref:Uncharacterized protein n=1 Tax=Novacetimonas maltaceti TaxID=1203393 RepID=A0A2S3VY98_9PROT|nr:MULTISPECIES: hypothetical protein [Acetobacteraceae]EGG78658.1 hypothetical protein SXCC_00639 [Gluconacetobacter sp. SXCC-1]POF61580.1 hypothetical protein KMAL_27990 [Novacetimonas maltaceti]PYD58596.1 hypothetical protein CFR73_14490 [Novacetimonas maltaceti]GCE89051.1 tail assembly protein [Komagataeibacter diospyri]
MFGLIFSIVSLVVSTVLQIVLAPKPINAAPATMKDFDYPQIEEGTAQPILFGDMWSTGWFVTWYGNMRTSAIKSSGGGKK